MSAYKIEKSAIATFIGIVFLFSTAIIVVLIAPQHIDPTWQEPTSDYQVQMYEVSDPHVYIGNPATGGYDLQYVYHLKKDFTLLAFQESEDVRLMASPDLEPYITRLGDTQIKLTSQLLLLRKPEAEDLAAQLRNMAQKKWEENHPKWEEEGLTKIDVQVLEVYRPDAAEVFSVGAPDTILENWVDRDFKLVDGPTADFHKSPGVIFVKNPVEYRIKFYDFGGQKGWRYDPDGDAVKDLAQLKGMPLGFHSRKELIEEGERMYAAEGCYYCHTDQTRTLIQDVVLNGSDSYPAPPSSANEYIYQKITFPGTRRIGPDLSRAGVKRPSRDWHRGHFWAPKTASKGSVMPAFQHFFDIDPRGTGIHAAGVPNYRFEAMFQYLMTKGTRITAPNEAWWLGKDPIHTKEIIEGRKVIK